MLIPNLRLSNNKKNIKFVVVMNKRKSYNTGFKLKILKMFKGEVPFVK